MSACFLECAMVYARNVFYLLHSLKMFCYENLIWISYRYIICNIRRKLIKNTIGNTCFNWKHAICSCADDQNTVRWHLSVKTFLFNLLKYRKYVFYSTLINAKVYKGETNASGQCYSVLIVMRCDASCHFLVNIVMNLIYHDIWNKKYGLPLKKYVSF